MEARFGRSPRTAIEGTGVRGSSGDEKSKNHTVARDDPGSNWICNQGLDDVARCDPRENLKGLGRTFYTAGGGAKERTRLVRVG